MINEKWATVNRLSLGGVQWVRRVNRLSQEVGGYQQ